MKKADKNKPLFTYWDMVNILDRYLDVCYDSSQMYVDMYILNKDDANKTTKRVKK